MEVGGAVVVMEGAMEVDLSWSGHEEFLRK